MIGVGININQPTNPREEHKDGLMDIESRYIQDIVAFFAKEYYDLFLYRDSRDMSGIRNQLMVKLEQIIIKKL